MTALHAGRYTEIGQSLDADASRAPAAGQGGILVPDPIIIDDYELLNNALATGNSTQVYEVRQKSSGQSFAMKLLLDEAFKDAEQKKSLKHEYTVGKSFDHPNVIRLFDLVMNKQRGYFIMEYFRSVNLKQMLRGERSVAQSRAKKILECVTQALGHMHEKNWVHKDLKPENILVTKGSEVKLIDFSLASRPAGGLGKLLGGSKIIQGTRTYIAPELIRRKPLSFAADMYSLGITFYELVSGRPPFIYGNPNELLMAHVRETPDRPSSYNKIVTPEADALIMRMIAKNPKDRPASMQDLAAELRTLKIFTIDPEEHARETAAKEQNRFDDSLDSRLNSRADANRDRSAAPAAPKPPPKKKVAAPVVAKSPAPPAAAPAPPVAPPMAYPAPPPGYPPQAYPPGYPQPMPQYAGVPPGWPPGYPPPAPGYTPAAMPPGYPYPPPAGAPPAPVQPQAAAPPPPGAPPAPPAPLAAAEPKSVGDEEVREEDLPLMTELPEVI